MEISEIVTKIDEKRLYSPADIAREGLFLGDNGGVDKYGRLVRRACKSGRLKSVNISDGETRARYRILGQNLIDFYKKYWCIK